MVALHYAGTDYEVTVEHEYRDRDKGLLRYYGSLAVDSIYKRTTLTLVTRMAYNEAAALAASGDKCVLDFALSHRSLEGLNFPVRLGDYSFEEEPYRNTARLRCKLIDRS